MPHITALPKKQVQELLDAYEWALLRNVIEGECDDTRYFY